jgi:FKBP-type peptidyl-prolyl cis-trans isomerase
MNPMHHRPVAIVRAAAVTLCVLSGCAKTPQPPSTGASAPTNSPQAASYSAGLTVGDQLRHQGVTNELSQGDFSRGLADGLGGKAPTQEDRTRVQQFIQSVHQAVGERNHAAAADFLKKNAALPDVKTTASGLQYKVLAAGDEQAPSPKETDTVTVQYRGTLLDGTEFDSSYKRGQPAAFPVNRVIKGWQEALQLMHPGAKWTVWVPPQLAYDLNSPPIIPPGSLLVFDVELQGVSAPLPPPTPAAPAPAAKRGAAAPKH